MSKRANPRTVGLFVVFALVLAVAGVAMLGTGLLFRDTVKFSVFFDANVSGLRVGAPVTFKGVEVGSVTEVLLDMPGLRREPEDFRIPVVFQIDLDKIRARGGVGSLADPVMVDSFIALGMRATLETESLVTGRKFIGLDVYPDSPINLKDEPGNPYKEIPVIETGLETIARDVQRLLDKIAELGAERLVESLTSLTEGLDARVNHPGLIAALDSLPSTINNLNRTIAEVRRLASSTDSTMVPITENLVTMSERAKASMARLDSTLMAIQTMADPDAPTFVHLESALEEIAAAARSMRELTEYLDRNPSAVLRGKPEDQR